MAIHASRLSLTPPQSKQGGDFPAAGHPSSTSAEQQAEQLDWICSWRALSCGAGGALHLPLAAPGHICCRPSLPKTVGNDPTADEHKMAIEVPEVLLGSNSTQVLIVMRSLHIAAINCDLKSGPPPTRWRLCRSTSSLTWAREGRMRAAHHARICMGQCADAGEGCWGAQGCLYLQTPF